MFLGLYALALLASAHSRRKKRVDGIDSRSNYRVLDAALGFIYESSSSRRSCALTYAFFGHLLVIAACMIVRVCRTHQWRIAIGAVNLDVGGV